MSDDTTFAKDRTFDAQAGPKQPGEEIDLISADMHAEERARRRHLLLADLEDLIYARNKWKQQRPVEVEDLAHDPAVIHRMEAVEALGLFPDVEAGHALTKLMQINVKSDIQGIPGQWLRDAALLTLLRSKRLPPETVTRALEEEYTIRKHWNPFSWGAVYEELPLLREYRKLPVFFRAFWSKPFVVLGLIASVIPLQMLGIIPAMLPIWLSFIVSICFGSFLYLVHQIEVEWIAQHVSVLPVRGHVPPRLKLVSWSVLFVIYVLLIVATIVALGRDAMAVGSVEAVTLRVVSLALPVLLVPMFALSRDLEMEARYRQRNRATLLDAVVVLLRNFTILAYIVLPFAFYGGLWTVESSKGLLTILSVVYLFYLFVAVLLFWAILPWLLRNIGRLLAGQRHTSTPMASSVARKD